MTCQACLERRRKLLASAAAVQRATVETLTRLHEALTVAEEPKEEPKENADRRS